MVPNSARYAATAGATTLVPPYTVVKSVMPFSVKKTPVAGSAFNAISGVDRFAAASPRVYWYKGFLNRALMPPPPDVHAVSTVVLAE